ncbi:MAG: Mur ligase family protein [Patescibacteria group bacterium]|jgi:UDP-N-acetylmuramoyl-tripeptide--D-alanyl-D-alanine ligase
MIYLIVSTVATFIHWLRWLALFQQKEYRSDRLLLFLKTKEGLKDFFLPWSISLRRLPNLSDFKRPRWTMRIFVVSLLSLLLIGGVLVFTNMSRQRWWTYLFAYLSLPLAIYVANVPAVGVSKILTHITLKRAKTKIKQHNPLIIGITGSYGKSSTKHLLTHIFSQSQPVFTTPKSYNTLYSVARAIVDNYQGETIVVLEYGAYTKGEIKHLAFHFPPSVAVVTGITSQHLGLFGSIKEIIKAKSELIKALPPQGIVFYNSADAHVRRMCTSTNNTSYPFGSQNSNSVLKDIQVDQHGYLSFSLDGKRVSTKLVGEHYISNIEAVIAISKYLKMPVKKITKGFETFTPTPMFVQSRILKSGTLLIDDGHTTNPKGFEAAIQLIKEIDKPRKILLTGGLVDLGIESSNIHNKLACQAEVVFDTVLYISQDGSKEFKQVFRNRCITEEVKINKVLDSLNSDTVILIEGHIKPELIKRIS